MNKRICRLFVLMGVFSLSLSSILAKAATAPSMVLSLYRTVFAVVALLPFVWKQRDELRRLSWRTCLLCLGNGAVFGIHFLLYCEAVRYTSIASATILIDSEVLFVAPVAHFLLREKINAAGFGGIILTLLGSLTIAFAGWGQGANAAHGNLLALSGAAALACFTVVSRMTRGHLSNTIYSFLSYVGGALVLLVITLFTGTPLTGYASANYLIAAGFTIFCTFGGHAVFSWALKYVEAPFISSIKLLEPILASMMAFAIFGQVPGMATILGGSLVMAGLIIYTKGGGAGHEKERRACHVQADDRFIPKLRQLP